MLECELKELRKKIFLTAYPMKTAHVASAFSIVEILYSLYCNGVMHYDTNDMRDPNRDRFILSKGHASLAVYAILNKIGVLSDAALSTFCRPGYSLGGEVNINETVGVEATTGSLGHGLSFGVGIAMALKKKKSPGKVYVLVGNGEIQEGVMWEAVMTAYKFKLDNLIVILDDNKIQKMGFTKDTMRIDSWRGRWEAFGWIVDEADGHNVEALTALLKKENNSGCPQIIIANTVKGKGVSIMENNADWHFKMPYKRELKVFMDELNISQEELENAKSISPCAL